MAAHWYIHQRDRKLGPMTSLEVREALREGTVDPMDLVSREGSAVKIELYEVDEIFSSGYDEAQPITSQQMQNAVGQAITGAELKRTVDSQPIVQRSRRSSEGQKGSSSASSAKRGRDPKKFFLYDRKKRKLGPLSAKEIQSIFYRGIVDQSAKVVKAGSDKKVPVATFVNVYAGSRSKKYDNEATQIGGLSQPVTRTAVSMPSSRVLDEMAMLRRMGGGSTSFTSLWLPIMAIVAGIALGYWAIDHYILKDKKTRSSTRTETVAPQIESQQREQDIPEIIIKSEPNKPEPGRKTANSRQVNKSTPPKSAPVKVAPPPPRQPTIRIPPKQPPAPRTPPPRTPPRETIRAAQRKPTPPKPAKAPVKPRSAPKASSGGGAVAALSGKIGQIGVASNMRFSKAALNACGMRCTLTFTDSTGGTISVVFFKGAYESALAKSSGRVTIRGRISGSPGSMMMILQGVN